MQVVTPLHYRRRQNTGFLQIKNIKFLSFDRGPLKKMIGQNVVKLRFYASSRFDQFDPNRVFLSNAFLLLVQIGMQSPPPPSTHIITIHQTYCSIWIGIPSEGSHHFLWKHWWIVAIKQRHQMIPHKKYRYVLMDYSLLQHYQKKEKI